MPSLLSSLTRGASNGGTDLDLEIVPGEGDPLISKVGSEVYGSDRRTTSSDNNLPITTDDNSERRRSSITESRRYEPLSERLKDVIRVYWHLGFIAFGGPSAHVAILRDHLLSDETKWMEEDAFMELFALGQGLPGPSSTQLVISTAATHGGALGGVIAFVMWCLPGFTILTLSGMFLYSFVDPEQPPIWLVGVPPAAMSLIFKASYGFVKTLDKLGVAIGMVSCVVSVMINGDLRIPSTSSQFVYPVLLLGGALATLFDFRRQNSFGIYVKPEPTTTTTSQTQSVQDRKLANKIGISVPQGVLYFFIWLGLLVGSTTLVNVAGFHDVYLEMFESFFRIGSLIFGGGVVMIPMAQTEFVQQKQWITDSQFFQGIGLAQSLPGMLSYFFR